MAERTPKDTHTQLSFVNTAIVCLCVYVQVNFSDFIEDLHGIYDLYTLSDANVIEDKPYVLYSSVFAVCRVEPNGCVGSCVSSLCSTILYTHTMISLSLLQACSPISGPRCCHGHGRYAQSR
jgi:hypothetical protein